jgi:Recombination endonuclease VII
MKCARPDCSNEFEPRFAGRQNAKLHCSAKCAKAERNRRARGKVRTNHVAKAPQIGLCSRCQKGQPRPGYKNCAACAKDSAEWQRTHRVEATKYMRSWRASHPEARKRHADTQDDKRRRITRAEFEARILRQNNRCPIGDHEFGSGRGIGQDNPCRDHCHETGYNRSILCNRHNLALGMLRDSLPEVQAVFDYLVVWKAEHQNLKARHIAAISSGLSALAMTKKDRETERQKWN